LRRSRTLAVALALLAPALAAPLEPRFDHRDTHGPTLEALVARDTVARSGGGSGSSWRPSVRVGWGLDASGEGDEVLLGATLALRDLDDSAEERVLLAVDARYRGYFGTDEAKTFFDVGVWAPLRTSLSAGPLVGLGFQYDVSRAGGVYAAGSFATAFGEVRVASFAVSVGAQLRFDLP
jgi:hypothetical protein